MNSQVFPIIPAGLSVYLILFPIITVLLIGGTVASWSAYSSRNAQFEVRADGIEITGDMYARFVPKDKMNLKSARAIDLEQDTSGLKPKRRTNGTSFPGYKSGWYLLENESRALLFVTDMHKVVYVPTVDGSALMVSVAEPERFLEALKR